MVTGLVYPHSYCPYLNVGSKPGVDPVRSQHVGQRGGAGEAGGHSVAHFRQRKHLEAKLLIQLLQFFIGLLFTLRQDTAHHIAAFLCRPLKGGKNGYISYIYTFTIPLKILQLVTSEQ